MADRAVVPWCCTMQWPGREPFTFGTIVADKNEMIHEVEAMLKAEFLERIGKILPEGWPLPEIIELLPGSIIFVPHDE